MSDEQVTVIGQDTQIKGEMVFDRTARILGGFEGRISSKGEVQIGATALCRATVEAENILVDGAVEGDLIARDRITLNTNARITGDLTATTLVVAEGATFHGVCRVGPDASAQATTTTAATTTAPTTTTTPGTAPTSPRTIERKPERESETPRVLPAASRTTTGATTGDTPKRPDWASRLDKTTDETTDRDQALAG